MGSNYVNLLLQAFLATLEQFGVTNIKRSNIKKKSNFYVDFEVSAIIFLSGGLEGNIALSMSQNTAKNLVSMMLGTNISVIDDTVKSAIGELASIIAGTSSTMSTPPGIFSISSPTVLLGYSIINSSEALAFDFDTQLGKIEFDIGLKI